ncbi:helicase-related protein [Mycolicibacterium sp. 120266]|uniref:helicase-related protein n=1 Tax=Mycolicibacterium sp. 120266 TaxID=3090601 RepID=UPI00299EC1A8|nr:helicase-related protein [Mycolicibacterium sp. 120266]MDX1873292.1 helicase-related protein [Mycolicibacterium sp. 120266]
MGAAYVDLNPGERPVPPGGLKAGRLGRIDRGPRPHRADTTPVPSIEPGTFGIEDKHIRDLITLFEQHQVIVVHAPTGSGKSTFLPWRLLNPPDPYPHDAITRHGTIVVTQPRIEATQGIPRFLASKLHGAAVGAGVDIGFRHSKAVDKSDSRNRLLFATDGTLLNMIRRGELNSCSTVVIDEAHERSLNIDLILALVRRQLVMLPQLRLLIVSATINTDSFVSFFGPEISATAISMPGKPDNPVYERWRGSEEIPTSQWPARMAGEVAHRTLEILQWMAGGPRPADIPIHVPCYNGDILAFLPGTRMIKAAVAELGELIEEDDHLQGAVEVLPLYAELPQRQRARALRPENRSQRTKWRVIVSTNIAETSLTIDGIRHVVDSGLINSTEWDSSTLTTVVRPKPHSRSGLLQRRGRAGRTASGIWHCLFSRTQFEALPFETPPEIVRAPLERVVLTAAAAGISDSAALKWLEPGPPEGELRRATATLRGIGAITADGDPTPFGTELAASPEAFDAAAVLMCADEAGVAVEAATVLAAVRDRRWVKVLRWSDNWPAVTRLHADRVHSALLSECRDDLDAVLLLFHLWEMAEPGERSAVSKRYLLDDGALRSILEARAKLLQSLQSRTKTVEIRPVEPGLADRLRRVIAWSSPNALYGAAEEGWRPVLVPRADREVVTRLHSGAVSELDSDTLISRGGRTPEFLASLVRDRRIQWISPLQDPADRVTLSFCVALTHNHLSDDVPLLAHVAGHGIAAAAKPPLVIPGERIRAELVGERRDGIQVRRIFSEAPLLVPDLHLTELEDAVPETGDLDQRSGERADLGSLEPDLSSAVEFLDSDDSALPSSEAEDTALQDNPYAELEIVSTGFDAQHPIVAVTGVVDGVVYAEPDPIAAAESFAARFRPGSECRVLVKEIRTLNRDRTRVLVGQEPTTGVNVPISAIEIGFGVRYSMLDDRMVGSWRNLAVVGTDPSNALVALSALPWTVGVLTRIAKNGAAPLTATIVDAASDQIWLALEADGLRIRSEDPPIAVGIPSDYLPLRPQELSVGQTVRVLPLKSRPRRSEVDLDVDNFHLPTGPFQRRGKTLTLDGEVTPTDVLAMYRAMQTLSPAEQIAMGRALERLVARTLRPRLRVIDTTGLQALAGRVRSTATILETNTERITVRTDTGLVTSIVNAHLAWPGRPIPTLSAGQTVEAFIDEVDVAKGRAYLSLRHPDEDPLRLIDDARSYRGLVVDSNRAGLLVNCADLPETVFIPSSETMVSGKNPRPEANTHVSFKVIEVDIERRRIVASLAQYRRQWSLPNDLTAVLRNRDRIDPNRLRPLVGDTPHLRIDERQNLVVRWSSELGGVPPEIAAGVIDDLVSGQVTEIVVPFLWPISTSEFRATLAADFRALLGNEKVEQQWHTYVVHPSRIAAEAIVETIRGAFPYRIVATGLRCASAGQFASALRAFREAERTRGQEAARLTFERPLNYVDLAVGDTWEAFAQRLASHSLTLTEPKYCVDSRIQWVSTGPVT